MIKLACFATLSSRAAVWAEGFFRPALTSLICLNHSGCATKQTECRNPTTSQPQLNTNLSESVPWKKVPSPILWQHFHSSGIWIVFLGTTSGLSLHCLPEEDPCLMHMPSWHREQANHNILLTVLKACVLPNFIHSTDVATGFWTEVMLLSDFHPFRTSHSRANAAKTLLHYSSFSHVSIKV